MSSPKINEILGSRDSRNSIDPFKEHQADMGCNILQRGAQED